MERTKTFLIECAKCHMWVLVDLNINKDEQYFRCPICREQFEVAKSID